MLRSKLRSLTGVSKLNYLGVYRNCLKSRLTRRLLLRQAQEHISFVASGTNLARLVDIGLLVPAVSGRDRHSCALRGSGYIRGSYDRLWQRSVAYNVNKLQHKLIAHRLKRALGAILGGIVFSADLPIRITCDNKTNTAQEGNGYRIVKLEEVSW